MPLKNHLARMLR